MRRGLYFGAMTAMLFLFCLLPFSAAQAQMKLTLDSDTGDRISGATIKSFSLGPDNNLVIDLTGPFTFANLQPAIWVDDTPGTYSNSTVSRPASVTAQVNATLTFTVKKGSGTFTNPIPVDPDLGHTVFFPSTGIFVWDTSGLSAGSYLAVFEAVDGANKSQLVVMIKINPQETVSAPTGLNGPSTGSVGQSYSFTGLGSTSSLGHPVEYQFDWGDGTSSSWSASSQSHSYASTGTFNVKVWARCIQDQVVSASSYSKDITISTAPVETVSTPTSITGVLSGNVGQSLSFTASGSISSLGHGVEYEFDWGDGTISSWGTATQSHTYNALGVYSITAKARCSAHYVESAVSGILKTVSISVASTGQYTNEVNSAVRVDIPFHVDLGGQVLSVPISRGSTTYFLIDPKGMNARQPQGDTTIYLVIEDASMGASSAGFSFSVLELDANNDLQRTWLVSLGTAGMYSVTLKSYTADKYGSGVKFLLKAVETGIGQTTMNVKWTF